MRYALLKVHGVKFPFGASLEALNFEPVLRALLCMVSGFCSRQLVRFSGRTDSSRGQHRCLRHPVSMLFRGIRWGRSASADCSDGLIGEHFRMRRDDLLLLRWCFHGSAFRQQQA